MSVLLAVLLFFLGPFSFSQTDSIRNGKIGSLPLVTNSADENILNCRTVKTEAKFRNGSEDWNSYLRQNLKTDVPKDKGCPPGRYAVRIKFIISKEGEVTSIKAVTNYGYGMETEAMRVISLLPQWTPSTRNGRSTNSYHCELITFDLCESVNDATKMAVYL